jgi:hypothetical protein
MADPKWKKLDFWRQNLLLDHELKGLCRCCRYAYPFGRRHSHHTWSVSVLRYNFDIVICSIFHNRWLSGQIKIRQKLWREAKPGRAFPWQPLDPVSQRWVIEFCELVEKYCPMPQPYSLKLLTARYVNQNMAIIRFVNIPQDCVDLLHLASKMEWREWWKN